MATVGGVVLGTANSLTLIATQGVIEPERAGEASGVTKTVITVAACLILAVWSGTRRRPRQNACPADHEGPDARGDVVGAHGNGRSRAQGD